jgi:hypothetical protein
VGKNNQSFVLVSNNDVRTVYGLNHLEVLISYIGHLFILLDLLFTDPYKIIETEPDLDKCDTIDMLDLILGGNSRHQQFTNILEFLKNCFWGSIISVAFISAIISSIVGEHVSEKSEIANVLYSINGLVGILLFISGISWLIVWLLRYLLLQSMEIESKYLIILLDQQKKSTYVTKEVNENAEKCVKSGRSIVDGDLLVKGNDGYILYPIWREIIKIKGIDPLTGENISGSIHLEATHQQINGEIKPLKKSRVSFIGILSGYIRAKLESLDIQL